MSIKIKELITQSILPQHDQAYTFGSSSLKWNHIYSKAMDTYGYIRFMDYNQGLSWRCNDPDRESFVIRPLDNGQGLQFLGYTNNAYIEGFGLRADGKIRLNTIVNVLRIQTDNNYGKIQLYSTNNGGYFSIHNANNDLQIEVKGDGEGGNIRFISKDHLNHWEMDANGNHVFRLYWGTESNHPDGRKEDITYFTFNGATGTISASNFNGTLIGNASSATLLRPTDNLDNLIYEAGSWTPPIPDDATVIWREKFRLKNKSDTGDLVLWINGDTKLNVTIDGNFFSDHGCLVLNTINWSSYITNISMNSLGANLDSQGYWGMASPDLYDMNYIRTPQWGLIPYESGKIGNSHSRLGTPEWWFSESFIETMSTNILFFNAHADDSAYIHTEIHGNMTYFDFNLCDDANDRWRWVGGLYNGNTGEKDWYESMVLTLQGVNNSLLRLNGVMSIGGNLHVDGSQIFMGSYGEPILRVDNEGVNLRLYSGNGHTNYWEMDSHDGNLRIYTFRESDNEYKGPVLYQSDGLWSGARWAKSADQLGSRYWWDFALNLTLDESVFDNLTNSGYGNMSYCATSTAGRVFIGREWGWNADGNNFGAQLKIDGWSGHVQTRSFGGWGKSWSNWIDILDANNYTSYCIPANPYISTTTNVGGDAILKVRGRVDMDCLLLTNTRWVGYGTVTPEAGGLSTVQGRVYFQIVS